MTASKGIGKGVNSGGKQPGAGRPKGAIGRKTKALIEKAASEGMLPVDYMLSIMRDPEAAQRDRIMCAGMAAPYVHSRLTALRILPDPRLMDDVTLATQLVRWEGQDAEMSEGERAAAIEDQFDRTLQDIGQLSVRRQEQFLGRLISAAESGLRRLDEMPDPPGTVVPRKPRQAPAPKPIRRPGAPAPADEPQGVTQAKVQHFDRASGQIRPGPLPR